MYTVLSFVMIFLLLMFLILISSLLYWLAGRLIYALGYHKLGFQMMAHSGVFTSTLPKYCPRKNCRYDRCDIWNCPVSDK